jgi:hypothetical protein
MEAILLLNCLVCQRFFGIFYTNLAKLLSVASIFHILILIFLLVFVFHGEQVISIGRPVKFIRHPALWALFL